MCQCLFCLNSCRCTTTFLVTMKIIRWLSIPGTGVKDGSDHNMGIVGKWSWVLCSTNRYTELLSFGASPLRFVPWGTETILGQCSISFKYCSYFSMWFSKSCVAKVKVTYNNPLFTNMNTSFQVNQYTFSPRCVISPTSVPVFFNFISLCFSLQ